CCQVPAVTPAALCAAATSNPVLPSAKCVASLNELAGFTETDQPLSVPDVHGREPITTGKSPAPAPFRLIQNSIVQPPPAGFNVALLGTDMNPVVPSRERDGLGANSRSPKAVVSPAIVELAAITLVSVPTPNCVALSSFTNGGAPLMLAVN